ncbi:MAG TPA: acetate/propionate family kinase, partial [Chloroflexia bacterium]|nr:acetate/propionate family kinase [Chloroflexia bacterium]
HGRSTPGSAGDPRLGLARFVRPSDTGAGAAQILVLNAGSSSLKVGLFEAARLAQEGQGAVDWRPAAGNGPTGHAAALRDLLAPYDRARITAVGHRVVHGGTRYQTSVRIDATVKAAIGELAAVAPLHNPAALEGIAAAEALLPGVPQVAAFDTAFHSTLAPSAYLYGVPYAWYTAWGLRRFGFHGLSHAYCAGRAAELLGRPPAGLRLVICHLGNGCSLAAVAGGRSVDTTMGFTPLDGVMMGTRSGAVDPGLLVHVLVQGFLDVPALDHVLNYESGLKGIAGGSGDMREVLAARAAGDARAGLALDVYTARIRAGIAAMVASLGGLDALVFTAGVGEQAPAVRAEVVGPLAWLGATLDAAANAAGAADCDVAAPASRVRVLVLHTREDLMVAHETRRVLDGGPTAATPAAPA